MEYTFSSVKLAVTEWGTLIVGRQKGGRAQPLKECSHGGHNINWSESTRSKMAEELTSNRPQTSVHTHCNTEACAKWHRCHDSSQINHKRPKSEWWPNSWKSLPFPQNSWNNPPTHSVQFSCSVLSNSLWPHGLQHARLPCPSPTPGAYSNSYPLSQWCSMSPTH